VAVTLFGFATVFSVLAGERWQRIAGTMVAAISTTILMLNRQRLVRLQNAFTKNVSIIILFTILLVYAIYVVMFHTFLEFFILGRVPGTTWQVEYMSSIIGLGLITVVMLAYILLAYHRRRHIKQVIFQIVESYFTIESKTI
jgi:hypothetical protein